MLTEGLTGMLISIYSITPGIKLGLCLILHPLLSHTASCDSVITDLDL